MDYQQPHGYTRPPPPPPPPSAADPYQRQPSSAPPPPTNQPWPTPPPNFNTNPELNTPLSASTAVAAASLLGARDVPSSLSCAPALRLILPTLTTHPRIRFRRDRLTFRNLTLRIGEVVAAGVIIRIGSTQVKNNEDDWGAKAKAWLAAKAATENQHPSSQFVPAGRPEEQNHFRDQYSQSNDPQFHDVPAPLAPASNYQQYPGAMGPPHRTGLGQLQDSQYISSGQPSYAADMHVPFAPRDGSLIGDSIAPLNSLVLQQEVPSSYSSVAGNGEAGDRYEKFNSSSSLPAAPLSQHHVQPLPPAGGRPGWMEEPHNFGSQPAESASDLSNQPLNFAPHFNRNLEPHAQPNYTYSSGGHVRGGDPISSNYAWPPSSTAQGATYSPLPPPIPPVAQVDHPIPMPSAASVHSAPMFPSGHGFQPTGSMMGASFGVGMGVTHPTAFSGDAYGVSERPKKASVPNWLREEIIKNKAVITSSAPEITEEDSQSVEEDSNDKSSRKGYQVDSKSIDSSRSTEDEDEDEDEVEAARTAAINQEIKRVLTEVLLKVVAPQFANKLLLRLQDMFLTMVLWQVTDELFDEIATKVLKEDDLSVDGDFHRTAFPYSIYILVLLSFIFDSVSFSLVLLHINVSCHAFFCLVGRDVDHSNHQISLSTQSVLTSKASARVLIPIKTKESDYQDVSEKSTSGAPGDVLGLGSYVSDEEDEEIQSSGKLNSKESSVQQSTSSKILEGNSVDENGGLPEATVSANSDRTVANVELSDHKAARDLASSDDRRSSRRLSSIAEDELQHGLDISKLNNSLIERAVEKNEDHNSDAGRLRNDDSGIQDAGYRYGKNDRVESKKNSVKRDHKDLESSKERLDKKGDEEHGRRSRTERTDHHDNSKDQGKEKGGADEKVKNTESRKRLSPSGGTDTHRDKRASGKKDNNERRQDGTGDEKRGRSRYKSGSESSRHKGRRSSSVGVRGRDGKDNSAISRGKDSSDQSSDDSRREGGGFLKERESFMTQKLNDELYLILVGEKDQFQDQGRDHLCSDAASKEYGGTRLELGEAKVFA
ncbi:hypothetical protein PHJA_000409400 [Phtheirospermum japonicum]|uniref:Uncharacterized protein n=1 Tax=Phtheirospermum japonicum TaxID=374723 RepID=A0A830BEG3_9LAMI|nr:hypothetical protein PHJA_000409400 [Phtheirospermum japonicum]